MEEPAQALERWAVYHRLQELGIPCRCVAYGPLEIQVETPQAAVLVWSVVRRMRGSRWQQVDWLERCWRLPP
ncbi:MAG: hypothetical protein RMI89_03620 [Gloeomargarita sp. SKYBB_i_bin120]|nr:hypothetical protein [Gloeomargarita sp. SKYG98]MCS7292048.1 hypothetical protein [Gloeomargarita sp. SKYB120]MDW8177608.1 hypothetical protein [Gloeomargarita sp. SKYBB_i_bin120]